MKRLYTICLYGCDDKTEFDMQLDEVELELVEKICKKSEETSEYICMPTMSVSLKKFVEVEK